MLPFFLLNLYFGKQNQDRLFRNDLSAIIAFSLSGAATYYLGQGQIDTKAWLVSGLSILFFIGSTFFVKSKIREKKNPRFHRISWTYHFIIVLAFRLSGELTLAIAFLPSLFRAVGFQKMNMQPKQLGIIEIINSCFFFMMTCLFFTQQ